MSLADDMAADAAATPAERKRRPLSEEMRASSAAPVPPMSAADFNPTTGDWYEDGMAGAGKAVADIGRGAGQILRSGLESVNANGAANRMGLPTRGDIDQVKRRDEALMDTGAGQVGYVGGNVAATMLPLGMLARVGVPGAAALMSPATYGSAAASGALSGALQPVGTDDSRSRNMVLGAGMGLAGNAAVNAVGRIAQPVQAAIDPNRARAVTTLRDAGVPLDVAQITGSPLLNRFRSSFADNPLTVNGHAAQVGAQRSAYNRAVLRTIGEDAPAATPEVMGRADERIGQVFHDVLSRNRVQVTDPLLNRLAAVQQSATDEERHAVSNIANRFIAAVDDNGSVPGQVAYNVKKDLDRLASSADTTLAHHARQLRTVVMDGMHDSLDGADRAAFSEARQQFRNMKTLEGAIDKEGAGNISPSILANTLGQKRNRVASIYGRGDQELVGLAQAGKQVLTDKTPNSGTTARAAMQIMAPIGASVLGGSYDAYQGDYTGAAAKGAALGLATLAGPRAAQFAITNPALSRYLMNGVQTVPLRSIMLAPQTNGMVGGALRRLPNAMTAADGQLVPAQ